MTWRSVVVSAAAVVVAPSVRAQDTIPAAGFGTIAGYVFDSTSGQPVGRARVCSYTVERAANRGAARCANTDYSGRYRLDSLPPGRYFPFAMCQFGLRVPSVALGTRSGIDSVPVRPGTVTDGVIFAVRDSTCNDPEQQRPRFVRGVFRGRYAGGTDFRASPQSVFTPCPGDAWPRADSTSSTPDAWVSWSPLALKLGGLSVLRTGARGFEGQLFYFVRFRGVLVGPRPAGPYRGYKYELVVDSILEARTPEERECR